MEINKLTKSIINSYRKILMKSNDEVVMHDLLETLTGDNIRSRVDLKDNNYVMVLDIDLQTLYINVASDNIDIKRIEEDVRILNQCSNIVTLIINNIGKDKILSIVTNAIGKSIARSSRVYCMELHSVRCNEPIHILRKATMEDKPSILRNVLEESGIKETSKLYKYAVKNIEDMILNNSYYVLVKDGFILAQSYIFEYENNIFIHGVLTNKNIRNKGIATDMMIQLTGELSKLNKKIYLTVLDNNTAAKRTYEKVGFKQIGESHYFSLT